MKHFGIAALATLALASTASAQNTVSPSKWGPNDEIGAANYITPARVLDAAKLVKTGKTYSLGIIVDSKTPAYPPRSCTVSIVQPGQVGSSAGLGPTHTTYNDDILNCWVGIGTQIDGLGHIGVGDVYYNGNKWADFAAFDGLKKLGVEKIPPIVARGVLLDMTAHFKQDPVAEGTAFNHAEIKEGDVVLFYTGWIKLIGKDDARYSKGEPGLGKGGAKYLTGKGVVAIGADTWALEVIPFEKDSGVFEVHQIMLPHNGTYILENVDTSALAAEKAYEFLFVLGHSKYRGAVQGMINPIAIR
ncbi:MAG: cyclase family protein [Reyranella sp.]|uniref:cyclase family protein n=1 Tax=Reyranella sp. TaxID=1929291 RepID=UPI001AC028F8|nr:cyclase family protein [Reyranella sp.]MBN9088754.1 cyclase family protein [Reyranella sp.]